MTTATTQEMNRPIRRGRLLANLRTFKPVIPRPSCKAPASDVTPFWTIGGLRSILNAHEDYCIQLIEFGHLAWSFDLAAGLNRRELRVLPQCVDDFQNQRECRLEWDDVKRLLAPKNPALMDSMEIQRVLNTTATHITNLAEMGQLRWSVKPRRGPCGSGKIATENFFSFLKRRAVL